MKNTYPESMVKGVMRFCRALHVLVTEVFKNKHIQWLKNEFSPSIDIPDVIRVKIKTKLNKNPL